MSTRLRTLAAVLALAATAAPAHAQSNVALNSAVTVTGPHTVSAPSAGRIVNGVYASEGTYWQSNDIWWNGTSTFITVNLGASYVLSAFKLQADNNDTYRLEFWNDATDAWQTAWAVPTKPTMPGVTTRTTTLAQTLTTSQLRLSATGGDNSYSVSQIEAIGVSSVPEPATVTLMATGLAALVFVARRRRA
jgi:hypothetical protein